MSSAMAQGTDSDRSAAPDLGAMVAAMARVGACWSPSFSSDGSRLAFVSDLTGTPQVWTVATAGGWPELVTALDDQVQRVLWSPDGAWLAFEVAPGGGMNVQVFVCRPDGSDLRRLTEGGKETNRLGTWSHDGATLAIASNRRRPEVMDVYLVAMATPEPRLVAEGQGLNAVSDLSRDGRWAVLSRVVQRGDSNLYLLDITSGRQTLLTPHDGPGSFGGGRFAPDGSTVYLGANADRELIALAQVRLNERGEPQPLEVLAGRDDAELEDLEISEDGRTALLVWNIAGRSELAWFDLAQRAARPGPTLPAEMAGELTLSSDGRYAALVISGATAPRDIWLLDRETGALRQVTHSPHAGVALHSLIRPGLLRFAAQDGLTLTGWLYRPRDFVAPGPVVLSFHGGPEGQERPRFNATYQALLEQGIAVFAPNVRGSSGFGKTFVNLDNGALRFDGIRDIAACVDHLVQSGVADRRRVGIMGGSYGGYMTMAGLTEYPDRFAAGANLFGIVNFETFFAHTEPWMAAVSKIEYGDPDTQADLLRQLSPIHKLDRVSAPTIVLHGANDTNVPVVEAEQTVAALRERGIPVEYVLFPDEGHGFRKAANRVQATRATVDWFVEYLKGA